jgi:hypothetical protein
MELLGGISAAAESSDRHSHSGSGGRAATGPAPAEAAPAPAAAAPAPTTPQNGPRQAVSESCALLEVQPKEKSRKRGRKSMMSI